jgi:membrane protein implicated in regulation of membrane protease activity
MRRRPAVRLEREAAMHGVTLFLDTQPAWHWWALGAVLLGLEIASTTQYLLWPGISALAIGTLKFFDPDLDGLFAVFLFAVFSVALTVAWKRSPMGQVQRTTHEGLNDRSAQYAGRQVIALDDFVGERGSVRVDDTRWSALAVDGSEPKKGDALLVSGADGTVLKVKAVT